MITMAPVIGPNFNAHAPRRRGKKRESAPEPLVVPEGDLESRISWVSEVEDIDARRSRADAIYNHEKDANDGTDLETLSGLLTHAVYGTQDPSTVIISESGPEVPPQDLPETPEVPVSQPETEVPPTPPAEAVVLPEGMTKVKDLEAWVGEDQAKAQAVLDSENSKSEADQRKTLIAKMSAITSTDGSDLI